LGEESGSNFEIVFDQLRLGDVVLGKQNFIQIGKLYLPFANLSHLRGAGHKVVFYNIF
jgi:hypothetical protein